MAKRARGGKNRAAGAADAQSSQPPARAVSKDTLAAAVTAKQTPSTDFAAEISDSAAADAEISPSAADPLPVLRMPVVGMGASAGGLDALKKFFGALPVDSGAAFVVVPHLDPGHESLMAELLSRQTKLPVHDAQQGMLIEPNCVYVIPPSRYLSISDGRLTLSLPAEHPGQTAIDCFLQSLASTQKERAVAVILSGTSSYGTPGLRAVKLAGGMVMVQKPESAEYDSMPRSAIATGLVDFVMTPEQMPDTLVKYIRHPYVQRPIEASPEHAASQQLSRILGLLRTQTNYDFRCYRKRILLRRVMRRMGLLEIESMTDYLEHLREHPDELTALNNDLLIGVTAFFRDPEPFEILQQRVIPELMKRIDKDGSGSEALDATEDPRRPIPVWVPACATGEEAYSIAMLFLEQFAAEGKPAEIQIFATDVDERSLEIARRGIYSERSLQGLSPERRKRFFTPVDAHHWQVSKPLRESLTIAQQNLISDAPFSNLDFISCRNLLIYLEPDLQTKVIRLLHLSLVDGGYLLLGPAESVDRELGLFETVSKKWRLFRRAGPAQVRAEIPILATEHHPAPQPVLPAVASVRPTGFNELMRRVILDDLAPAAALIDRRHEIQSVFGPLAKYLEFPSREITKNLLMMARPGLRTRLRRAINEALLHGKAVEIPDGRVKREGVYHPCAITVKPVVNAKDSAGLLLISFQDRASRSQAYTDLTAGATADEEDQQLVQQLEHELESTRSDLHSTVEDYESSTEELKASNEEIMSMNEELQSTNEELQTSKEELQSLNEELTSVNQQLQEKVAELDRTNNDILNLMTSSDVATLFIDRELRIKRFTPLVAELLRLRASDRDRPITDLAFIDIDSTLLDDCRSALSQATRSEREVWIKAEPRDLPVTASRSATPGLDNQVSESVPEEFSAIGQQSRCYLRRILPYRTMDNRIAGIVVTFIDITQRIAAEAQSRRLASVLWNSNDAIVVQDFGGRIIAWNRGAERIYGYTEAEALRTPIRDLVPEPKRSEAADYAERIRRSETVEIHETQRLAKDGRLVDVELTVTAYRDELGVPIGITTTERDISERKQLLQTLQHLNENLEAQVAERVREVKLLAHAMSRLGEGVVITADKLIWPGPPIIYVNEAFCKITGYSRDELLGSPPNLFVGEKDRVTNLRRLRLDLAAGHPCLVEMVSHRKDGTPYDAELFITPLHDSSGRRTNFVTIYRDISERKRAERRLNDREALARSILDSLTAHVAVLDQHGDIIRVNAAWNEAAEEDRITDHRRIGVGSNYIKFWEHAAQQGDEVASSIALGLQDLLQGRRAEFTIEYPYHSGHRQQWYHLSATPTQNSEGGAVVSHVSVTDRKLAELALQREHELSESIIETSQMIVLFLDPSGRVARFNRYMEELTGWRLDEVRGQDWFDTFIPASERENLRRIFGVAIKGESTRGQISPLLTKDGREREIVWFDSPLHLGQDEPIGLLCTGNDVTEQRQIERRRDAQFQLTRILSQTESVKAAMPQVLRIISQCLDWQLGEMWAREPNSHSLQLRCVWHGGEKEYAAFEAATRAASLDDEASFVARVERSGEPLLLIGIQDNSDLLRAAIARKAGFHTAFGFPVLRGGKVIAVFAFFSSARHEPDVKLQKQMEAFGKQVGDFIHRKADEKALRDRDEALRAILETATDAIITIDQRGLIESVNPATLQMFQYTLDELIGKNVSMLMPQPYRQEHDGYLRQYQQTGEAKIIGVGREVTAMRKDGSLFPVDLAVSEADPIGLYTGIVRDISLRKNLQKQVLEISSDEHRRIGQELHDGTGQVLTGLTLFARTLSVLLNEKPNRAAEGAGEWSLSEAELQQLRQIADRLAKGLGEANQHVQQLSHGILPVQVEPAGLAAALEQLAIDTDALLDVSCSCEIPDALEVADNTTATHLYRIAQEAVNNALRHSQASEIEISLRQVDHEIVLEVQDNGVGLRPQEPTAPSAFDRNHGCGLEIMHYRAGIIGGTLQIGSNDDGGTTVRCIVHRGSVQHA